MVERLHSFFHRCAKQQLELDPQAGMITTMFGDPDVHLAVWQMSTALAGENEILREE